MLKLKAGSLTVSNFLKPFENLLVFDRYNLANSQQHNTMQVPKYHILPSKFSLCTFYDLNEFQNLFNLLKFYNSFSLIFDLIEVLDNGHLLFTLKLIVFKLRESYTNCQTTLEKFWPTCEVVKKMASQKKSPELLLNLQMLLRTSTVMQKKASFMGYRDSENAINRQSSNIIYSIQQYTHTMRNVIISLT